MIPKERGREEEGLERGWEHSQGWGTSSAVFSVSRLIALILRTDLSVLFLILEGSIIRHNVISKPLQTDSVDVCVRLMKYPSVLCVSLLSSIVAEYLKKTKVKGLSPFVVSKGGCGQCWAGLGTLGPCTNRAVFWVLVASGWPGSKEREDRMGRVPALGMSPVW